MKLFYLANMRLPTEKAHGLQIMQMGEAFACAGADVTLLVPRRLNSPEMNQVADVWAHYGVARRFGIRRIPCLDLFPWLLPHFAPTAFIAEMIRTVTYLIALVIYLLFHRADVYYSRDPLTLLALSLFKPRRALAYEAHHLAKAGLSVRLQSWCVRRVSTVIAVTGRLADDLKSRGASRVLVAHDGIRAGRFANLPDRRVARARLKLPPDAFIAGYIGQLHTMSMSKGIDVLIDALARLRDVPISLCLIGGPDSMALALRERWLAFGLPVERFLYVGRLAPADVPMGIAAFDVCTMPFPWTEHFAYHASPLKLFEYMACGGTILSSDLPATAEVVHDGETALLVPPGDVDALAAALRRLYDDPALRQRLGQAARIESARYTWQARAESILAAMKA